jgi:SAM-dependent methyltransferase
VTLDLSAAYGVDRFTAVRDRDLRQGDEDLGRWLLVEPEQLAATGDPGVTGYDGPQQLGRWFDWSAPFAFPDWFLADDDPVVQGIASRDLSCLERLGIDHDPHVVTDLARYTAQDHWLTRCYPMPGRFRPRVVLDLGPGNGRLANALLHGDDPADTVIAVEGIAGPYLTQRAYYVGLGLQVADYLDDDEPAAFDVAAAAEHHDVVHLPTWRLDLVADASVDLVCAVQVLRELPAATVRYVLDHLQRIVRPGGAVYVRDHLAGHDLTGLPTDELLLARGFELEFAPQVRDRVDLHGVPRVFRRTSG